VFAGRVQAVKQGDFFRHFEADDLDTQPRIALTKMTDCRLSGED